MSFFSRLRGTSARSGGVLNLITSARSLSEQLASVSFEPVYLTGFVSPHIDIDQIARSISARFPHTAISLCTTSGELSSKNDALYCATGDQWDRVVLALFDSSVIQSAEIVHIPLHSEDIRSPGGYLRSLSEKARAGKFSVWPMLEALHARK